MFVEILFMNKLFVFVIVAFSILTYSCTQNVSGTATVVPIAPTNLSGTVISTNQINLSWSDKSTNEDGFKVERKIGAGTYIVVATLGTNITTFNDMGLTPNTTYTYRIYAYNSAGNSLTYSNELTLTIINFPTLTTTAVSSIATTVAVSGGTISNDGGATITAKGVCWSTSINPTIALSTKTNEGAGTGVFTSNLAGLIPNTTYYIRSYATNSAGTAYGNELSFTTAPIPVSVTDIDGNIYSLVTICNQTWTKTNLNVTKYRNGDIIPQVTDATQWASLNTGAWCYYSNTSSNGTTYGKLYNWFAVIDPRGLAPTGYHIPTDAEWTTLTTCLGGTSVAGGAMKATGTTYWASPNTDATNSSSFTGLPGGGRNSGSSAVFSGLGNYGCWWSATYNSAFNAWNRTLFNNMGSIQRGNNDNQFGLSVRCIKD
jgi:uncharacterized protein (TIGR02145 family)